MSLIKVKTTEFIKLQQSKLSDYAQNVHDLMTSNPLYKDVFGDELVALDLAIKAYLTALAQAINRDKIKVALKNTRRNELIALLNEIAMGINLRAKGDINYVLGAGFSTVSERTVHRNPLHTPVVLVASPNTQKGQLQVVLDRTMTSRGTTTYAMEYSNDGGVTWVNGNYSSSTRGLFQGLPSSFELLIRFRAIGTHGRVSGWSMPTLCTVL